MTMGHAVKISPVLTASYPMLCCRINGSETIASICAVKEHIEVTIESEKIGMRSRSNGSMGMGLRSWYVTNCHATTAATAASTNHTCSDMPCE